MKRGASGLGGGGGRGSGGASGGGTAPVSIITISGTTPWAQAHSRRKMASAIIDLELEPLGAALDAGLHGTAHTAALNEFRRFLFMKGIAEDFDGTTIQAPAGPLLALWNMMVSSTHLMNEFACVVGEILRPNGPIMTFSNDPTAVVSTDPGVAGDRAAALRYVRARYRVVYGAEAPAAVWGAEPSAAAAAAPGGNESKCDDDEECADVAGAARGAPRPRT